MDLSGGCQTEEVLSKRLVIILVRNNKSWIIRGDFGVKWLLC